MTNHNTFPEIQLHPLFILFAAVAIISGSFVELITILVIVIIHECGHYVAARFFSWRIIRMYIWIFGAVMETEEHGVRSIREEAIVVLFGPFQHIWIYGVTWILQYYELLHSTVIDGIFFYNTVILVFNLLPIWPLDGGKILYLFLTYVYPYQRGYENTLIISCISCILLSIWICVWYSFHIQWIFMMAFLLLEIWREWKNKSYVYMRFLLHRLQNQSVHKSTHIIESFPHEKISDVLTQFRREHTHMIVVPNDKDTRYSYKNHLSEQLCINYYFYQGGWSRTIDDVYQSQFIQPSPRLHIK